MEKVQRGYKITIMHKHINLRQGGFTKVLVGNSEACSNNLTEMTGSPLAVKQYQGVSKGGYVVLYRASVDL